MPPAPAGGLPPLPSISSNFHAPARLFLNTTARFFFVCAFHAAGAGGETEVERRGERRGVGDGEGERDRDNVVSLADTFVGTAVVVVDGSDGSTCFRRAGRGDGSVKSNDSISGEERFVCCARRGEVRRIGLGAVGDARLAVGLGFGFGWRVVVEEEEEEVEDVWEAFDEMETSGGRGAKTSLIARREFLDGGCCGNVIFGGGGKDGLMERRV